MAEPEPEPTAAAGDSGDDGDATTESARAPAQPKEFNPMMYGARPDGNFGILLDKKSPTAITAWQQRWVVITPQGQLYYFENQAAEKQCRVGADGKVIFSSAAKKKPIELSECEKITSNNLKSFHFEFNMVGGKKHQFRMHKEVQVLQGTTAGGMNIYDQEAWQGLQFALQHLEDTGVLGCSSQILDVGGKGQVQADTREKKQVAQGRAAVLNIPQ